MSANSGYLILAYPLAFFAALREEDSPVTSVSEFGTPVLCISPRRQAREGVPALCQRTQAI